MPRKCLNFKKIVFPKKSQFQIVNPKLESEGWTDRLETIFFGFPIRKTVAKGPILTIILGSLGRHAL
jgi:hypothetical protein